MRRVSRLIAAFVLVLVTLLSFNIPVNALSCAETPSIQREKQASELVFKGIVSSQTDHEVRFHVTQVWKGEVGPKLTLARDLWSSFEDGEEYIVFALESQGAMRVSLCGNTGLAANVDENALGASISMVTPAISDFWKGFMIGAGGTLVVAGALILGWVYSKKKH